MEHQLCRCKDNVEEIIPRNINGRPNIPLKYVTHRFDKIEQQNTRIGEALNKVLENTEILKRQSDAILSQTFELAEFTVPRLFLVLPENTARYNPAHWFHLSYRLYFLCECDNDNERHFAYHEGYEIKQPREFFRKYGPYLRQMLTVSQYAISIGSLIVPQLSSIASGISNSGIPQDQLFWNNLRTRVERLDAILTEVGISRDISTTRNVQHVEGADLREIESFLKTTDDHRKFGNLYRSVTMDGHVRWVCINHYKRCYSDTKIKDLHEEFQQLGGAIKQDTAVIEQQASINSSTLLSVLRRGLRVCSIILKNLHMEEEDFEALLSYVSQHSTIHSLQIENITVLSAPFNMKKRIIILKLDDILRTNDKLYIQYSFTKPLSRFDAEVMTVIPKTNSRLVFQVRPREDTSSFALAGTNETGFTLSIHNSDEKNHITYHTAIRNIFLIIPNIRNILLHRGVISNSIWTCFRQFLTANQSLQELTIDCRLTSEQIQQLSRWLNGNTTLKTLHLFNVWERTDELKEFKTIFHILQMNTTLVEFSLTCHTDLLQLGFIARCLLQNKSLRVLRLTKCRITQNIDVELFESFLQNTSIHTLSLQLISTNSEASLNRLVRALDKNETLETLELKDFDCSAIFHRTKQIPDNDHNNVASEQNSIPPPRSKLKRFVGLFSCHRGENRRHLHETVSVQEETKEKVSSESFDSWCTYPPLYKQIKEIAQNLNLEELRVTIGDHVWMTDINSSIRSNSTVTELISRRTLIENDIRMLVEALRNNTTITHLSLNEVRISLEDFRQIFDVLRDHRVLRVLDVSQCVWNSDRNQFVQEVEALGLKNPFLKVVYENQ